eukprot:a676548_183.p1 GENE.a676548_183~~a676548_183.p1  ORF type:complete len:291 (-),score=95.87 a676548_183:19-858(-)
MATVLETTDGAALEAYVLQCKNATPRMAIDIIRRVTSDPQIFVFAELLDLPSVAALEAAPEHKAHVDLLKVFAYGTHREYQEKKAALSLPDLSAEQERKLRLLTIVSLAVAHKSIPYDVLLEELALATLREMEDMVIDALYSGVILGKMDQRGRKVHVQTVMGRDVAPSEIDALSARLAEWISRAKGICGTLGDQATEATRQRVADEASAAALKDRVDAASAELVVALKEAEGKPQAFSLGPILSGLADSDAMPSSSRTGPMRRHPPKGGRDAQSRHRA